MSGGAWRYEVVSGQHHAVRWVQLRETYVDEDGQVCGYVSIASAATVEELVADFREWLAVAEAYQAQGQA